MKHKILTVVLMGAMAMPILSGCSKDNEIKNAARVPDNNAIYGEVSVISDDSITIKVGTMNMERKDGFDASSMIELTGEEKEIKITDDTVVKSQQMGGLVRGNMGNPSEMPSGEDGSMPEMHNGGNNQETPPEMPSGEDGQGIPPEMPSGEDGFMPEGEGQGGFGQMAKEIDLEDVLEGDIVSIILDDDGNAKEIIVMVSKESEEETINEQDNTSNQAKIEGVCRV